MLGLKRSCYAADTATSMPFTIVQFLHLNLRNILLQTFRTKHLNPKRKEFSMVNRFCSCFLSNSLRKIFYNSNLNVWFLSISDLAFISSKLAMETLENIVRNMFKVENKDIRPTSMTQLMKSWCLLFLTLEKSYTLFWCFHDWL